MDTAIVHTGIIALSVTVIAYLVFGRNVRDPEPSAQHAEDALFSLQTGLLLVKDMIQFAREQRDAETAVVRAIMGDDELQPEPARIATAAIPACFAGLPETGYLQWMKPGTCKWYKVRDKDGTVLPVEEAA
jgi:hypothetical protein